MQAVHAGKMVFTGYTVVNIYVDKCVCLSIFLLSLWLNDVRRYDSVGLMFSSRFADSKYGKKRLNDGKSGK